MRLFNPRAVLEATRLARIKELSLGSTIKGSIMNMASKKGSAPGNVSVNSGQDHKGILGKPNYKFQSKMTPNEFDEHRAKGLCFFCHERFAPGHMCPQRQMAQVFFMEVEDPCDPQEEQPQVGVEEKTAEKEEAITLTLNSLFGNTSNDLTTMRITGSMEGKTLHILIDMGSSHNFLSDQFFKKGAVKTKNIRPLRVTVANGNQVQGT